MRFYSDTPTFVVVLQDMAVSLPRHIGEFQISIVEWIAFCRYSLFSDLVESTVIANVGQD